MSSIGRWHWLLLLLLLPFLALGGVLLAVALRLGPLDLDRLQATSTVITDRHGAMLRPFAAPDGAWRLPVTAGEVDPVFLRLLIAYEDGRFYRHGGVDPWAVVRAGTQMLVAGQVVSGASTLTMQTARLLERRPRGLSSKLAEMLRAWQLEQRWTKDQILSVYLTLAPYGGSIEGVRAASLIWFGKEPRHLSLAEAALLVALPQSPERRRPDRHPQAARRARDRVLQRMAAAGVISFAQASDAMATPVPTERQPLPFHAAQAAEQAFRAGQGRTTLDLSLQRRLQDLAARRLASLGRGLNIGILVMDARDGAVQAWVGSADYFDAARRGAIDYPRAIRSPGSTLKPALYALAFDLGLLHPATLVEDRLRDFRGYRPVNFDRGHRGLVTAGEALQRSLNTPAVAILDRIGPAALTQRLAVAGIPLRLPAEAEAGLPIALGGVGVTLADLVALYAAFARADGRVQRPHLWAAAAQPAQSFLAPEAAETVRRLLMTAPRPTGALPAGRSAVLDGLAFKTGTSFARHDAWAIGTIGAAVIGVWVGAPALDLCSGCTGIEAAAPILVEVAQALPLSLLAGSPVPRPLALQERPAPPALLLFDRPVPALSPTRAPPRLVFPADGTVLHPGPRRRPVAIQVQGGVPPIAVLVDGRPVALLGPGRAPALLPMDQPGFATVQVVAADGQSDRAAVQIAP